MRAVQSTITTLLLGSGCLLFAMHDAFGSDLPVDWNAIRTAGMGGSATAVAIDETAPFYNPAGLGRIRNPRSRNFLHILSIPGLTVGGNSMALKGMNAAFTSETSVPKSTTDATSSGSDWFEKERFGRVLSKAMEAPGEPMFGEVQFFPVAVMGARSQATWLVGFPARSEFSLGVLDKDDTTKAYIRSRTTVGGVVGLGSSSLAGMLSYGVSVRPNYRYAYETFEYPTSQTSFSKFKNTVRTDGNTTFGMQGDAGVMFILPDFWFPTFGLSVRNIPTSCVDHYRNPVTGKSYTVCGSPRSGDVSDENREDSLDPAEVRAGFAITPRFRSGGMRINLRLSVDAFPLPIQTGGKNYGFTDLNVNQIMHAGAELFVGNPLGSQSLAVRAGSYGSDLSMGATLYLLGIELEYATYPGYSALPGKDPKRDRRHLIGLSTRW